MRHFAMPHAKLRHWAVLCIPLLTTAPAHAQPGGEDPANQYYRYNNAELEAVCDAMSPSRYISGLTEGTWGALPGSGKTYYYRSACYLELVQRTGRAELCPKVVERRTLLGDGASHSPQRCLEVAAAYQAAKAKSAHDQAAFAQSVEGAFTIRQIQVHALANGNWRLDIQTAGTRPGDYVFRIRQVRDSRLLLEETHALSQPTSRSWELNRTAVLGSTALPNIFPMAVSISYRRPATASAPASEHITTIQNFTLSAN
jgi:hypothetical protein